MSKVRILPLRTHRLGGVHCQVGVVTTVAKEDADLAIRHRWAIEAPAKAAKPAAKAKPDGEAAAPAPDGEAAEETDPADADQD